MTISEMRELAVTLDCLLNCLAAMDTENSRAMDGLPRTISIGAEKSTKLCEAFEQLDK